MGLIHYSTYISPFMLYDTSNEKCMEIHLYLYVFKFKVSYNTYELNTVFNL